MWYLIVSIPDLCLLIHIVHSDRHMLRSFEINRGSYMSAHVLLNLLNELGKRDKMIKSLFRNKFNKFNNTRA